MYCVVAIQPFGCNTTINFIHSFRGCILTNFGIIHLIIGHGVFVCVLLAAVNAVKLVDLRRRQQLQVL